MSAKLRIFTAVAALFLATAALCSDALESKQNYLDELNRLDDLRLADFSQFQQRLAALSQASEHLTQQELDYLVLLQGSEHVLLSNFEAAKVLLDNRLKLITDENLKIRAIALLVNSSVLARDYTTAFEYFELLLNNNAVITDEKALVQRLGVIALLYIKLRKFELAQYYLKDIDALPISAVSLCRLYTQKIEALAATASIYEFDNVSQTGLDLCIDNNETIPAGFIVTEIIRFNAEKGRYNEAVNAYYLFKDQTHATGYNFLIAKLNAFASVAFFENGNTDQAIELAKQALVLSKDSIAGIPAIEASRSLYEIFKSEGKFQDALNYLELFQKTQKEYSDDLYAQLLAYNLAKGEIEVKNQRIALLDKDNEVLALQRDLYEQEARQNRLLVLILAAVLLLASVLAYRGMTGRQRFKKIAEYDQLTGVSNRYHFNNQAQIALDYCDKNAKPVALLLFDLDHFKQINDAHGHAAGDWALQAVVKTCRNFMRNNDVFGRIGGEEFAVLLPGCQTDKAALLAEICRDAIASIDCSDSGFDFPLTASFGVSGSDTSGYVLKQLLSDADVAMYQAKADGRNTVSTFG
ncbi:GGDEF domain-containing protein [Rheinheimera fenheensis]|uniref:GGDEF domain-containing protein n=1 Tax=Rheinheimera fenheensis TaxID=3152295 RepID=UPI00325EA0FB